MFRVFSVLASFAMVVLSGCERKGGSVPFRVADAYFVNNDVESVPPFIRSVEERDSVLGMATTMFNAPTVIDFENEVAVPVVLSETNMETDVNVTRLTANADTLVVSYGVERGGRLSYSIRPFALVVVAKGNVDGLKYVRLSEER